MFLISINSAVDNKLQLHRETLYEITSAYGKIGWGRAC